MLPSEQIHIGSQVGRVYRLVLREDSQVFALLMVLLEYATQPKKSVQARHQLFKLLQTDRRLAIRQSMPEVMDSRHSSPTPEYLVLPLPYLVS